MKTITAAVEALFDRVKKALRAIGEKLLKLLLAAAARVTPL